MLFFIILWILCGVYLFAYLKVSESREGLEYSDSLDNVMLCICILGGGFLLCVIGFLKLWKRFHSFG